MSNRDPRQIAEQLWSARRHGSVVSALSVDLDETQGYAIQDALIAAREDLPAGWKAGATAPGGPHAVGLSEPMSGPLWSEFIYRSGENVAVWSAHRPQAEVELAFRLGAVPRASDWASINDSIDGVTVAIELTGWRFADLPPRPGPQFLADHASNACAICGSFRNDWADVDFSKLEARLNIDGVLSASGKSTVVMGDPRNAVEWLCKQLARRGHALAPGQIIMSGAIIPVTAVQPGTRLSAACPPFGEVTVGIYGAS